MGSILYNGNKYTAEIQNKTFNVIDEGKYYSAVPSIDLSPYLKIRNLLAGSGVTLNYTSTGVTVSANFNGSSYALKSNFNTFTGTTAPSTYELKSNFNTYTGATTTALNGKLSLSSFSTYSGTTVPATFLKKSVFNSFTGSTITGGTNGLVKIGRHLVLGGSLNSDTIIDNQNFQFIVESSTNGSGFGIVDNAGTIEFTTENADLTILNDGSSPTIFTDLSTSQSGLQYAQEYNYKPHSLVTASFVTGITSAIGGYVSKPVFASFTGTTAPATYVSKTSFNTYTGATTPNVTGATNGLSKLSNKKIGLGGAISGNTNQQSVIVYSSPLSGSSNSLTLGVNRAGGYYSPYFELIAGGNNSTPPTMLLNNGSAYFSFQGGVNPSQAGSLINFTDGRSVTRGIEYVANYSAGFQKFTLVDVNYVTGNTISKAFFNNYTGTTGGVSKSLFNSYTGTTAPATYLKISPFNTYSASTLTSINAKLATANNGLTAIGSNVHLGGTLTGATQIDETSGITKTFKLIAGNLGTTQTDGKGLWLQNAQAATSGNQQISPAITWEGQGWKTTSTAGSQSVKFKAYVTPVQGTVIAQGNWGLYSSVNGSGNTNVMLVDTSGATTINANSTVNTWNLKVKSNNSGWILKDMAGAGNSSFPALYDNGVTPSSTNYTLVSATNNTYTNVNASSFLRLNIAGNIKVDVMPNSTLVMNKLIVGSFANDVDNVALAQHHVKTSALGAAVLRTESVAASNTNPNRTTYHNKLLTTGATVTTIHTVAIGTGTTTQIKGTVTARRVSGSAGTAQDGGAWEFSGAYSNTGATKIIGSTVTLIGRDQSTWSVALNKSASNLLIQVNGAANNNVSWVTTVDVYTIQQ